MAQNAFSLPKFEADYPGCEVDNDTVTEQWTQQDARAMLSAVIRAASRGGNGENSLTGLQLQLAG